MIVAMFKKFKKRNTPSLKPPIAYGHSSTPHHHPCVLHLCFMTHTLTSQFASNLFCASFELHHQNSQLNFALALLHLSLCVITLCLFFCIYHLFVYMPYTTLVQSFLYIYLHICIFHNVIITNFVAIMDNSTRVN